MENEKVNLGSRANFFLENLNALVAFPSLVFREAPYCGPSVQEKERSGVGISK